MPKGFKHLTREQRNHIQQYSERWSQYRIADSLGVHVSTVSRELRRNRPAKQPYCAATAHQQATQRRTQASNLPRKILANFLDDYVFERLENGHSPKVVANTLDDVPHDPKVSARWLYELLDRRHRLGDPEPAAFLHRKYKKVSPLKRARRAGVHMIPNRVDIAKRPAHVLNRQAFGHWEGDTVVGAHHQGALVTVLERKTRMLICRHVNHRTKDAVADAIVDAMKPYAAGVASITFDNGGEFAAHKRIAKGLACNTYFARPFRSCERGANEHVNGLLRRYYPKGQSLRDLDHAYLIANVAHLNSIPREILGYQAPHDRFIDEMNRALLLPN